MKQRRHMSIFRSKSEKPKPDPLQINTNTDFPDHRPVDRWSTRRSVTHESPANQQFYAAPEES